MSAIFSNFDIQNVLFSLVDTMFRISVMVTHTFRVLIDCLFDHVATILSN